MAIDIKAHITGTIWKIPVKAGDKVEEDDTLVIIESMKMEMPIEAEEDGEIVEVLLEEGSPVQEGDVILRIEED